MGQIYKIGDKVRCSYEIDNSKAFEGQIVKISQVKGAATLYFVQTDDVNICTVFYNEIIGPAIPLLGDSICDMHDGKIPPYLEVVSCTTIRSQFGGDFIVNHLAERLDSPTSIINKILYVIEEENDRGEIVCAYSYDACIFGIIILKLKKE